MFRKLVSNLPFSPALVGQLGFYAKRLRREEFTRRLGLIFTALALVVQFFTVFAPSESANAASDSDFVRGGVSSLDQLLGLYDQNSNNLRDMYSYAGITRAEIAGAQKSTINSKDGWLSWGRTSPFSAAQGDVTHTYQMAGGGSGTLHSHPLSVWDTGVNKTYGSTYTVWIGQSTAMGTFAILKNCANLATKKLPTPPPAPAATCDNLEVSTISRTKFRATAWASVSGGAALKEIHYYVYGSNGGLAGTAVSSGNFSPQGVDLSLGVPDTYTVRAYAITSAGNQTSANCVKTAVVGDAPYAACTNLTTTAISRTVVRANASVEVRNGAAVQGYDFTMKDKTGKIVSQATRDGNGLTTVVDLTAPKDGEYTIEVTVRTTDGVKTSSSCKKIVTISPEAAAVCSSLKKKQITRTIVQLIGTGSVANGATIKSYTFTVKDSSGKTVSTKTIQTNASTATTENIVLNTPGDYVASLSIDTSLGSRTDTVNCVEKMTIEKPAVCYINPNIPATDVNCQPCPGNPSIWIKDADCSAELIQTKTATNVTKNNVNATSTTADAGNTIRYTVVVENKGYAPTSAVIKEDLTDVSDYAAVTDNGGALYDSSAKTLTWPTIQLKAGEKQTRVFSVKVADTIPATSTGTSNRTSYDCVMTNTFGNTVNIAMNCPPAKVVENVVTQLPKTGATENLIFAGIVFSVVTFFYARARQMKQEVRLIRRDLNAGTI